MIKGAIEVTTWDNSKRKVQQVELRAEYDNQHEIFFKIEGKFDNENFMVDYSYDKNKSMLQFFSIMKNLIDEQQRVLKDN